MCVYVCVCVHKSDVLMFYDAVKDLFTGRNRASISVFDQLSNTKLFRDICEYNNKTALNRPAVLKKNT